MGWKALYFSGNRWQDSSFQLKSLNYGKDVVRGIALSAAAALGSENLSVPAESEILIVAGGTNLLVGPIFMAKQIHQQHWNSKSACENEQRDFCKVSCAYTGLLGN